MRSIGAPNFIFTTIKKEYKLPFASFPAAVRLGNNKSGRLHANHFVDQAILELVNSGGFVGFVSSLLLLTPCR